MVIPVPGALEGGEHPFVADVADIAVGYLAARRLRPMRGGMEEAVMLAGAQPVLQRGLREWYRILQ